MVYSHRKLHVLLIIISSSITIYLRTMLDSITPFDTKTTKAEEAQVYVPIAKLYPIDSTILKADVSIGIVCKPDSYHIQNTKEAINSIISKFSLHSSLTFHVYIAIHSQNEIEINMVKESFKSQAQGWRAHFITLSQESIDTRMENKDTKVLSHQYHDTFMRKLVSINMLMAIMFRHASQQSHFFIHTDPSLRTNDEFMNVLKDSLDWFDHERKSFRAHLTNSWLHSNVGYVYKSQHLEDFSNYLYHMSPFQLFPRQILIFTYYMAGLKTKTFKAGFANVASQPERTHINPGGVISTTLVGYDSYLPANPYTVGTYFWGPPGDKNSFLTIRFDKDLVLRRVVVVTGFDIFLQDSITRAVLEESNVRNGEDCGIFKRVADFRSGGVDLGLNRTSVQTSCLRIRFVMKEKFWVAIRSIQVYV